MRTTILQSTHAVHGNLTIHVQCTHVVNIVIYASPVTCDVTPLISQIYTSVYQQRILLESSASKIISFIQFTLTSLYLDYLKPFRLFQLAAAAVSRVIEFQFYIMPSHITCRHAPIPHPAANFVTIQTSKFAIKSFHFCTNR